VATRAGFTGETAPCGSVVDGTRYQDGDDEGMRVVHLRYGCGCQDFLDDFHDGSTHRRVTHHSGRVLLDEELRGE
jgi:hypothetical protein